MTDLNQAGGLNAYFETCAVGEPVTPDFKQQAEALLKQQREAIAAMQQAVDIYEPGGPGEAGAREFLGEGYDGYIEGTRAQIESMADGLKQSDACINPDVSRQSAAPAFTNAP